MYRKWQKIINKSIIICLSTISFVYAGNLSVTQVKTVNVNNQTQSNFNSNDKIGFVIECYKYVDMGRVNFEFYVYNPSNKQVFSQTGNSINGTTGTGSSSISNVQISKFFTTYGYYKFTGKVTAGSYSDTKSVQFYLNPPIPGYSQIQLISPFEGQTVNTLRPTFTWQVLTGTSKYRLIVSSRKNLAVNDYYNMLQEETAGTSIIYPSSSNIQEKYWFKSGQTYYWRVEALNESGGVIGTPSVVKSFKVQEGVVLGVSYTILSLPDNVKAGDKVEFKIEVKNIGTEIKNLWFCIDVFKDNLPVEETYTGKPGDTGYLGKIKFTDQNEVLYSGSTKIFSTYYTFTETATGHKYDKGTYKYLYQAWQGTPGAGGQRIGTLQTRNFQVESFDTVSENPYLKIRDYDWENLSSEIDSLKKQVNLSCGNLIIRYLKHLSPIPLDMKSLRDFILNEISKEAPEVIQEFVKGSDVAKKAYETIEKCAELSVDPIVPALVIGVSSATFASQKYDELIKLKKNINEKSSIQDINKIYELLGLVDSLAAPTRNYLKLLSEESSLKIDPQDKETILSTIFKGSAETDSIINQISQKIVNAVRESSILKNYISEHKNRAISWNIQPYPIIIEDPKEYENFMKKWAKPRNITVGAEPAGAKVYLDNEVNPRGETKGIGLFLELTIKNVYPGIHQLKVTKDGYKDEIKDVFVSIRPVTFTGFTFTLQKIENTKQEISYEIQSLPDNVKLGDNVDFKITVKNKGQRDINNLWFCIDIFKDNTPIEETYTGKIGDTGKLGKIKFEKQGEKLVAGSYRLFSTSYTFHDTEAGYKYSKGTYKYLYQAWEGIPGTGGQRIGIIQTKTFEIIEKPIEFKIIYPLSTTKINWIAGDEKLMVDGDGVKVGEKVKVYIEVDGKTYYQGETNGQVTSTRWSVITSPIWKKTNKIFAELYSSQGKLLKTSGSVELNLPAKDNPPVISILEAPKSIKVGQSINISTQIKDDNGIKKVEIYLWPNSPSEKIYEMKKSGGGANMTEGTWDYSSDIIKVSGYISYLIKATDSIGQITKNEINTIKIENHEIKITIIECPTSVSINQSIGIRVKVHDDAGLNKVDKVEIEYKLPEWTSSKTKKMKLIYEPPKSEDEEIWEFVTESKKKGNMWYIIKATNNLGEVKTTEKKDIKVK